jgi:immune inhibitor A
MFFPNTKIKKSNKVPPIVKEKDESMKSRTRIFALSLLAAVLIAAPAVNTFAMPPHPDLLKEYREGRRAMPAFLKDPAILKAKGINQPPKRLDVLERLLSPGIESAPSGNFNSLALLVDFSDKPARVGATYFDTLIFGTGHGTVRDYYREVSYATLTIVTVNLPSSMGWKRAPQTNTYYANGQSGFGSYPRNAQKLVEDAVDAADSVVNFAQYDNDHDGYVDALFIVHAGPGAEFTGNSNDIWSHQWAITPRVKDGVRISTYSMEPEYWVTPGDMTLGVYCHELGHVFGVPDLYDYDNSSAGLGNWSLMSGGSWNGHLGNSPAHPDAWSRTILGFNDPTVVTQDTAGAAISAVENQAQIFYLWDCGNLNDEFFLIENRQQFGYDAALPGSGLLVWHVDQGSTNNDSECLSQSNCNCASHYLVALEQADGLLHLEKNLNAGDRGDCFPGSAIKRTFDSASIPNSGSYIDCKSGVSIRNISNSASAMTADFYVCSQPPSLSSITLTSPADLASFSSRPTVTWSATGGANNAFAVDLSSSPTFTSYWSTYENQHRIISGTTWTMPLSIWNKIALGSRVYWRVRGADRSVQPLSIIFSQQTRSFYKQ